MLVRFRGTRGSIPTALTAEDVREKVIAALLASRGKELKSEGQIRKFVNEELPFCVSSSYGGNTPCVEIETDSPDEYLIFDGGSGIRQLGMDVLAQDPGERVFHIFLSHLHYDHIQGLPFFAPAYAPGNKIIFHGGHEDALPHLQKHMDVPFFPVPMKVMQAEITYERHAPEDVVEVCGHRVSLIEQDHPGVSYGYRIDKEQASAVYSTDAEHRIPAHGKQYPYIDFIRGADLLIFDAPYTLSQSIGSREDWGHSSNVMAVELAARAEVHTLALFHHDPAATDAEMDDFLRHTKTFLDRSRIAVRETRPGIPGAPSPRAHPRQVIVAYDGLEFEI